MDWTPPGEDGKQDCPRHPEAGRWANGCPICLSSPPVVESEPGEGERLCRDAERRGLPDAFEVEARMWNVWRMATRRSETAAAIADRLSQFPEDGAEPNALFDLDLAAKYEAVAAKYMDVSVKAGKLATVPVLHRERMAEMERRARLLKGQGGN